jgi:hypothetical protein
MGNFDLNQKISSILGLLFVLIASCLVAWFSLSTGASIVDNAPDSKIFNPTGVTNELK